MKKIYFFFIFFAALLIFSKLQAQTNISGTINTYTAVTAFDTICPNHNITVASGAGFSAGDTVLIIQMQGATMDETNTASFGDVTNYNDAGNYEFLIISAVVGNIITFQTQITRTYTLTGNVQLIHVPTYTDANISGTLTGQAWDGSTGGVIVVWVNNTLTFNANIDATDIGFRGGIYLDAGSSSKCGFSFGDPQYPDYFYNFDPNLDGAYKGEGITEYITNKEYGRGKQTNGGGGGNDHNSGGAGGGNGGNGGNGGERGYPPGIGGFYYCRGYYPGIGAVGLTYNNATNKIFLGGGSGAGQINNNAGLGGANGAGIVILKASSINGNSNSVLASGSRPIHPVSSNNFSQGDGSGGGGAGGTVLIDASTFTSNLNVDVSGGHGGDNNWGGTTDNCMGPGGGGGGGIVWVNTGVLSGNIVTNLAGGASGSNTGATCTGETFGATAGTAGSTLTNLNIPFSAIPACNTVLPVNLSSFEGRNIGSAVSLDWKTFSESNNQGFEVQRYNNQSTSFETIGFVNGNNNSNEVKKYNFKDYDPQSGENFYRLNQLDFDGNSAFSTIVNVKFDKKETNEIFIFPNPLNAETQELQIVLKEQSAIQVQIFNQFGNSIFEEKFAEKSTFQKIKLEKTSKGIYTVKVSTSYGTFFKKIVIM